MKTTTKLFFFAFVAYCALAAPSAVRHDDDDSGEVDNSTDGFLGDLPNGFVFYDNVSNSTSGRRIHPLGRQDLCVTVQQEDLQIKSGASVEISYCFSNDDPSSAFQLWDIASGSFSNVTIPLSANRTNLVLDAMPDGGLRLNEIGINPTGQSWTKTSTGGLTIGGDTCLAVEEDSMPVYDLPWGSVVNLFTDDCDDNDVSQFFFVLEESPEFGLNRTATNGN